MYRHAIYVQVSTYIVHMNTYLVRGTRVGIRGEDKSTRVGLDVESRRVTFTIRMHLLLGGIYIDDNY